METVIKRDYKLADDSLRQKGKELKQLVNRDLADFASRGVLNTSSLETLIADFEKVPSDEYCRGMVGVKTQERNAAFKALGKAIRSIRTMALNTWGEHDAHYRIFHFEDLNLRGDVDYRQLAKNVYREGYNHLVALEEQGLTAAKLETLKGLREELETKVEEKERQENFRDLSTQERIIKGNALYKGIVRLCNIGKDLYANSDSARYNQYVIKNKPLAQKLTDDLIKQEMERAA